MPPTNAATVWFETITGSRYTDEDAKIIGPELARIVRESQGELCAADIVEAARDPRSPLHAYFEWDDEVAAHMWREEQARHMTRGVYVCWQTRDAGKQRVRLCEWVFVAQEEVDDEEEDDGIPEVRPGRTVPTDGRTRRAATFDYVVEQADLCDQMIARALADLQRWERRYQYYRDNYPEFKQKFRRAWNAINALGDDE